MMMGCRTVPAEILKLIKEVNPIIFLETYTAFLSYSTFHSTWKAPYLSLYSSLKAMLGLIYYTALFARWTQPSKVLKHMLWKRLARLTEAIVTAIHLSRQEHGFRTGLSAINAFPEAVVAVRGVARTPTCRAASTFQSLLTAAMIETHSGK